jgi:CubicO group peptidase (beta-lactamase class C family)
MQLRDLDTFLGKCVEDKKIPGCVCWVGNGQDTLFFEQYGHAQIVPHVNEMKKDTVFDLASLTKPIATAFSIMLLQERGLLQLDNRMSDELPILKESASAHTTVKQLLTHTSGLPAWHPTYLIPEEKRLEHTANLNTGDEKVVYSCLGYVILGKIIEQITHTSLARFFRDNIAQKLGLRTMRFGPVAPRDSVAPTETGNTHEKEMARQYGDVSRIKWRQNLIRGEVHDGNAFYGFKNVAGNAGLFSNAADLAKLTQAYLSGGIINKKTLSVMTRDHTGGAEKRGLGWRMDPYPGLLSPGSFGHTGFTGTMLVVDPQYDLIIILLANAVHPKVKLGLMNPIRRETVRLITETLDARR